MITGIPKKIIFFSFLFINFLQPSKSAEFAKINKIINNRNTKPTWLKLPSLESPSNLQDNLLSNEINDVIYAEGNVSVAYKGKLLKADTLIYDKLNKKISAKGNISLELGDQFFKVKQLEYNFINEKGYLLDVKGSINTNTLMDDLSSNFSLSDINKIESLLEIKKKGSFIYP